MNFLSKIILLILCILLPAIHAAAADQPENNKQTTKDAVEKEKLENDKETTKYECEIHFKIGKADVNYNELEDCVKKVAEDEDVKFVQIISSTNLLGSFSFNKRLSDKRLEAVHTFLKAHLKNITTKFISIGKNSQYDKKAYILILAVKRKDPEIKIVEKEVEKIVEKHVIVEKEIPKKEEESIYELFVGARLGVDIYLYDQIRPYFAYGFVGGMNFKNFDNIIFEVGLSGSQLVNDHVLSIYNVYIFGGSYLVINKQNGIFIGVRGLGGAVFNQKHESDGDFGGEARAGYRNSLLSLSFGAGRTIYTTRMGFELTFHL